uniref:Transposase-associated domain-containing protein n=1 Tax=Solanum tuberosum TaxID=4113 RepID=M1DQM8_SOLTU
MYLDLKHNQLEGYSIDVGDKSWMDLRRSTDEYIHGVNDFLDKAFERASQGDEILCPSIECLTFISRYLPDMVKTIFSRYPTEDDEDNQTEEGDASPLFPKTGHPIGSMNKRNGKTFNMEHHEWFEAHRYALFNTGYEKVEAFIKNKVPVDLYDLEEENCPNIEETFWRETNDDIGSSERVLDVDVRWSRENLPVDIIDLPALAQHSEDITMETSEEENDFDDTDWDWMDVDD